MNSEITLKIKGSEDEPVVITGFGRKLTIGDIEISRSDRTASARKVKDVIATKKKINLSFDLIDTGNLNMLKAYYYSQVELEITLDHTGSNSTYTVLMAPFDWSRVLSTGGGYWSGVNIEFEEV